jgi:hypothetical protein
LIETITVEPIEEATGILAVAADRVTPTQSAVTPDQVRSVRFVRTTVLRKEPHQGSDKVGVIRRDVRVAVQSSAPAGGGCKTRWIEIAPRGWACEDVLEASREAPTEAVAVSLTDDVDGLVVVPGTYGVVRDKNVQAYASVDDVRSDTGRMLVGNNTVRAAGSVTIDGRRYWRTTGGELIAAGSIATFSPSKFQGVVLDGQTSMPAWVRGRGGSRKPIKTRDPGGKPNGTLEPRTVVTILEHSEDGRSVRVGDRRWVARTDLRVASVTEPPEGTGASEKWFDIDLDQQVLVAYEGKRPVYATLVSTGKYGHTTPTRITRISSKLRSATMNNDQGEVYSVADVPWTMFYDGSYALHAAYWHNSFGGTRSHGCINLSPRDARLLFHWSSPDVPVGWIAVYGDEDHPGSLVRVRSRQVPEPAFHGYARTMRDRANRIADGS